MRTGRGKAVAIVTGAVGLGVLAAAGFAIVPREGNPSTTALYSAIEASSPCGVRRFSAAFDERRSDSEAIQKRCQ